MLGAYPRRLPAPDLYQNLAEIARRDPPAHGPDRLPVLPAIVFFLRDVAAGPVEVPVQFLPFLLGQHPIRFYRHFFVPNPGLFGFQPRGLLRGQLTALNPLLDPLLLSLFPLIHARRRRLREGRQGHGCHEQAQHEGTHVHGELLS